MGHRQRELQLCDRANPGDGARMARAAHVGDPRRRRDCAPDLPARRSKREQNPGRSDVPRRGGCGGGVHDESAGGTSSRRLSGRNAVVLFRRRSALWQCPPLADPSGQLPRLYRRHRAPFSKGESAPSRNSSKRSRVQVTGPAQGSGRSPQPTNARCARGEELQRTDFSAGSAFFALPRCG